MTDRDTPKPLPVDPVTGFPVNEHGEQYPYDEIVDEHGNPLPFGPSGEETAAKSRAHIAALGDVPDVIPPVNGDGEPYPYDPVIGPDGKPLPPGPSSYDPANDLPLEA